ncbi:MAG: Uma2 family endonuclease [Saprospiraceae bacterium]|nr:MAG: Uma2 family endonuclease [Saprospiraceae bacterium]
MKAVAEKEKLYSFEEYLEMEVKSEVKHEFHNGKLIPMAGGTLNHNTICGNIIALIFQHFFKNDRPCATLTSDQKVYLPSTNRMVYPDVTVYCGEPEFYLGSTAVISNPLLIVEVLSEETAEYDRTTKFDNYSFIPSFREYMLVAQDRPFVEAFFLHDPETGLWKISRAAGLNASITLHSVDCTLALKDIYRMAKDLKEA